MSQAQAVTPNIEIPYDKIAEFCRKWRVTEFALFGSVLRNDFRPDSDVDVLVTFAPDARRGLMVLARMQAELETIFGRKTHVITRGSVETSRNYIRRKSILGSAQVVHVS